MEILNGHPEWQYINTLKAILAHGTRKKNRTGTDTLGILGVQHRYNLQEGFPLFTTKRTWFKGVKIELLWFLSGSTNIKYLVGNGVNIWNDDAYRYYLNYKKGGNHGAVRPLDKEKFIQQTKEDHQPTTDIYKFGDLGPGYGKQWRKWEVLEEDWKDEGLMYEGQPHPSRIIKHSHIDQIANLIDGLKNNPDSRRHILTAWNIADIDKMGLPPCHVMSQYSVVEGKLYCHMYQRSCDMPLGVPFNVASYALLTHLLAQVCDLGVGDFIHTMHDCHIYVNQIDGVHEILERTPLPLPELELNPDIKNIDDFKSSDIKTVGYKHHPPIKFPLST